MQLRKEAWKKFKTSTGFEPVTSRYRCDAVDVELYIVCSQCLFLGGKNHCFNFQLSPVSSSSLLLLFLLLSNYYYYYYYYYHQDSCKVCKLALAKSFGTLKYCFLTSYCIIFFLSVRHFETQITDRVSWGIVITFDSNVILRATTVLLATIKSFNPRHQSINNCWHETQSSDKKTVWLLRRSHVSWNEISKAHCCKRNKPNVYSLPNVPPILVYWYGGCYEDYSD